MVSIALEALPFAQKFVEDYLPKIRASSPALAIAVLVLFGFLRILSIRSALFTSSAPKLYFNPVVNPAPWKISKKCAAIDAFLWIMGGLP